MSVKIIPRFAILLCCTGLGGQTTLPLSEPTFHVQGTITGPANSIVSGAEVRFQSDNLNKSIISDGAGFYEADLPVGLYTMTALLPKNRFLATFQRPLFRVDSSTTLTLNAVLYLARRTCDFGTVLRPEGSTHATGSPDAGQLEEATKGLCGGEDVFPIASREGTPFQLYIRYPRRLQVDGGWAYNSDLVALNSKVPVLAQYNLFTLLADHVVYNTQRRTIEAKGEVIMVTGSGMTQTADSMTVKIDNGDATRLH